MNRTRVPAPAARNMAVRSAGTDYAKGLSGVSAPMGFFDPLNLSDAPVETVKRFREAELTHGRVCMLATIGVLTGEAVEPNAPFFDAKITGPAIVHFQQVPGPFWEFVVFGIALAEGYRVSVGWANPAEKGAFTLKDDYEPGEIGFDPLGFAPKTPEEFDTLQTKEINNGRLAMISIAGYVAQELVNSKGILENLL